MKDNSKFFLGVLVGAIAGAALAVFISSDAGMEVIDEIKDATGKAEKDLKKAISLFEDKINKGKGLAMDMEKKAGKFMKQRFN